MRTATLIFAIILLAGSAGIGQEARSKSNGKANMKNFQPLCLRGFDSTGNLMKELSDRELDVFFHHIYRDSSVAQIKNDFEHPNKELAPLVGKLSEETKRLLLKTARFGPGPNKCSKDPSF